MKKAFVLFLGVALLCFLAADANAVKNANAKWALHYAGAHNAKTNSCAKDFNTAGCDGIVVTTTDTGHVDIFVLAVDVAGIAGTRYGICCDYSGTAPYFYGWTKCSALEIPTVEPDYIAWPDCGAGNAQTWSTEQVGPIVPCGILEVYIYAGTASMSVCPDPREGFSEWCDGTQPSPVCFKILDTNPDESKYYGSIHFDGTDGYNPCSVVPVVQQSWGSVKSIYR